MSRAARSTHDDGGATVEFVFVSILVVILVLGIVQVALSLHVRNMVLSAASAGARYAATYGAEVGDGQRRTETLISGSLGDYPATVVAREVVRNGVGMVVVEVEAPLPVLGLWEVGSVSIRAHGVLEEHRG